MCVWLFLLDDWNGIKQHMRRTKRNAATMSLGQYFLYCFLYTLVHHSNVGWILMWNDLLWSCRRFHLSQKKFNFVHNKAETQRSLQIQKKSYFRRSFSFSPQLVRWRRFFSHSIVLGCFYFPTCRFHCCFLLQIKLPFFVYSSVKYSQNVIVCWLFSSRFVVTVWF